MRRGAGRSHGNLIGRIVGGSGVIPARIRGKVGYREETPPNMAARLISYHLKSPEKGNYEAFAEVIQAYDYVQLSETCYAVASDEYPKSIFEKLAPYIDEDDCLIVIALSRFYMAHHDHAVLEWLEQNV